MNLTEQVETLIIYTGNIRTPYNINIDVCGSVWFDFKKRFQNPI